MSQSGSNGQGRGGGWKHNNRGRSGRWRGHSGQRGGWKGGGGWRGGRNYNNNNSRSNRQSAPLPQVIVELVQTTLEQFAAFKGWRLYFPTEVYSDTSPIVKRVKTLEKYFRSSKELYSNIDIETQTYFTVDFKELLTEKMILDEILDMSKELTENPETVINCFGLAMHQILATDLENDLNDSNEENSAHPYVLAGSQVQKIHCRLVNVEPIIALKNLKANYYGKFVTLKGTVIRVNNIKPLCTQMAFECQGCGHVQAILLPEGKYMIPTQCPAAECRSRTFIPLRSHHLTLTVDWQTIRIQEIMNDEHRESGRIPRTVDCELTNDLVDSCTPGDMVTLSGIVKVQSSDDGTKYRQRDKCMFLIYIDANSVTNAKGKKSSNIEDHTSTGIGLEFTTRDFYSIENVQSQRKLFRLIVGSLCPSIFGHELVKAGLVLGLFGGTQKFANDKNRVPVRGDPHILVVGDPGLGKSQLLMAVTNVAPRSVYVCGNTTTTSGLTVTLSKEGRGTGDYSLEAGALVLADQGVCCIDEFDKMGQQHQALLEAMEQQSISIAKAGIVCSLPARTSILAAANPVGGHYDQSKTVSENLRMGSALLSRFDLVFIILDKPDEDLDSLLSEHVMTLHCGKKRTFNTSVLRENDDDNEEAEADKPLLERLKIRREEPFDPIPHPVLRKYIAYARRYVHPKISPAAAKVLQEFYLDLRRKHQTQDSTPITTRQLESLIRLTEARARVELREETTEQDAVDVIDIMKDSMVDTQLDAMGFMDFSRSQHGSGMSKTAQVRKMTNLLQQRAQIKGSSIFSVQDMKDIAREGGVKVSNFEDLIMNLNVNNHILSQGPRIYKLTTY